MASDTFWSQAALEPKRQFRFVLVLGAFEKYVITKVNRPSFEVGEAEHNYINHKFYYPGRVTWNDVSFSLVDAVRPDTTGILMKMLMASGYRFPNDADTTRTISKVEAVNAIGTCAIQVLGASKGPESKEGEVLETLSFKNPWIKSVTMGDLDYGADDILSMDVTMKYDWATLSLGNDSNERLRARSNQGLDAIDNNLISNPKG